MWLKHRIPHLQVCCLYNIQLDPVLCEVNNENQYKHYFSVIFLLIFFQYYGTVLCIVHWAVNVGIQVGPKYFLNAEIYDCMPNQKCPWAACHLCDIHTSMLICYWIRCLLFMLVLCAFFSAVKTQIMPLIKWSCAVLNQQDGMRTPKHVRTSGVWAIGLAVPTPHTVSIQ